MMKRRAAFQAVAIVCLAMPFPALAVEMSEFAGVWRVKTTFGTRTNVTMLRLNVDSGALSGVLLRRPGQETVLQDVRLDAGNITFATSSSRRNGRTFVTRYSGSLTGAKIEGKIEFRRGSETREWNWTAERSDEAALVVEESSPPVQADIELTEENYAVWRDHILPDQTELAWKQIPWHVTFKDGILAANASDKPLLFWTMNGHPLGCT
jgi:hypothetical protein